MPEGEEENSEQCDRFTAVTLSMTASVVYPDETREDPKTYTIPLRTTAFRAAHLSIRNATGAYVDHISGTGAWEIITDFWIPGMFLRTGMWTFEIVAKTGDGSCLFAASLTQWLEHSNL